MRIADLAQKYAAKIKLLEESRQTEALTVTSDVLALIINRIQNTGVDADGNKFAPYSKNELPLFYFGDGNSKTKADKFKKDVRKKKTEPTYENFRQYLGLPTDKRTFTVTGEMLGALRASVIVHNRFVTIVEIAARSRKAQDLVNYNSGMVDQSIIRASKSELVLVEKAQKRRIANVLKDNK